MGAIAASGDGQLLVAITSDALQSFNALLLVQGDGAVAEVSEFELEGLERVSDLLAPPGESFILASRTTVQSRTALSTIDWSVTLGSARVGHLAGATGTLLAVGTQNDADEIMRLAAVALDPSSGAEIEALGSGAYPSVKYVSDASAAPDGRVFVAITNPDADDTAVVVAIATDGASETVWSGPGESGGIAVDPAGFVDVLTDTLGPYETSLRRVAISLD